MQLMTKHCEGLFIGTDRATLSAYFHLALVACTLVYKQSSFPKVLIFIRIRLLQSHHYEFIEADQIRIKQASF
jgi:hypothetical protein